MIASYFEFSRNILQYNSWTSKKSCYFILQCWHSERLCCTKEIVDFVFNESSFGSKMDHLASRSRVRIANLSAVSLQISPSAFDYVFFLFIPSPNRCRLININPWTVWLYFMPVHFWQKLMINVVLISELLHHYATFLLYLSDYRARVPTSKCS